jgi:hypothetical protein
MDQALMNKDYGTTAIVQVMSQSTTIVLVEKVFATLMKHCF